MILDAPRDTGDPSADTEATEQAVGDHKGDFHSAEVDLAWQHDVATREPETVSGSQLSVIRVQLVEAVSKIKKQMAVHHADVRPAVDKGANPLLGAGFGEDHVHERSFVY